MPRQEEDMLQCAPSCPEDGGKGLEGGQQGEPSSPIRLCYREGVRERARSQPGRTQWNPPSLCLHHRGSQMRQWSLRNAAAPANFSFLSPGCPVCASRPARPTGSARRPQAHEGRGRYEVNETSGGSSQEDPGAVSWSAGASQGLWPDQGGPYFESQLSFRDNSWPSGLGDFAWNYEDTTPQGPNSLLLPDITEAALPVHTLQPQLGGGG